MSSSFLSMNRTYERVVNITDMPDFSQYMKIKIKKEQGAKAKLEQQSAAEPIKEPVKEPVEEPEKSNLRQ